MAVTGDTRQGVGVEGTLTYRNGIWYKADGTPSGGYSVGSYTDDFKSLKDRVGEDWVNGGYNQEIPDLSDAERAAFKNNKSLNPQGLSVEDYYAGWAGGSGAGMAPYYVLKDAITQTNLASSVGGTQAYQDTLAQRNSEMTALEKAPATYLEPGEDWRNIAYGALAIGGLTAGASALFGGAAGATGSGVTAWGSEPGFQAALQSGNYPIASGNSLVSGVATGGATPSPYGTNPATPLKTAWTPSGAEASTGGLTNTNPFFSPEYSLKPAADFSKTKIFTDVAGATTGGAGVADINWWDVGIQAVSTIGSAYLGQQATQAVAGQQLAGQQAGIDEQRRQFDLTRQDYAPWLEAGKRGLSKFEELIGGGALEGDYIPAVSPFQFGAEEFEQYKDPGYGFRVQEGERGVNRALASMGKLGSGNRLRALMELNQNMASQEFGAARGRAGQDYAANVLAPYDRGVDAYGRQYGRESDVLNRLASLSDVGQTATANVGRFGAYSSSNISNLLAAQGSTRADEQYGQYDAWSGALSDLGRQFQDYRTSRANPYDPSRTDPSLRF